MCLPSIYQFERTGTNLDHPTKGATIDAKDKNENTPLHFAASSGNTGIVELLIKNGANTNAKTDSGDAPLLNAVTYDTLNHTVIANLLIENGADIEGQDDIGYTPLHKAAWAGSTNMVNLLIDLGANVFITDIWGQTALDIAKRGGVHGTDNLKSELIKKIDSRQSELLSF